MDIVISPPQEYPAPCTPPPAVSLVFPRGSEKLPTPQQVSTAISNMKASVGIGAGRLGAGGAAEGVGGGMARGVSSAYPSHEDACWLVPLDPSGPNLKPALPSCAPAAAACRAGGGAAQRVVLQAVQAVRRCALPLRPVRALLMQP